MNFDNIKSKAHDIKSGLKKSSRNHLKESNNSSTQIHKERTKSDAEKNNNNMSEEEQMILKIRNHFNSMKEPIVNVDNIFDDNPLSDEYLLENITKSVRSSNHEKSKIFRYYKNYVSANQRQVIPKYYTPFLYDRVSANDKFIDVNVVDDETEQKNEEIRIN